MVAEVADHSAAFVSALEERVVAGPRAGYAQDQQRRMSPGRRVDLEDDIIARSEIGERRGEQFPGRLDQRRV